MTSAVLIAGNVHADKVRVAVIDPLSGACAPQRDKKLHSFQMIADIANKESAFDILSAIHWQALRHGDAPHATD